MMAVWYNCCLRRKDLRRDGLSILKDLNVEEYREAEIVAVGRKNGVKVLGALKKSDYEGESARGGNGYESRESCRVGWVLFTLVWMITHDCQPLHSPKELSAHRDRSMGKAETFHISHTPIPLLKWDSNHSLSVENP